MMDFNVTTFILSLIDLLIFMSIILCFFLKPMNKVFEGGKNKDESTAREKKVDKGIANEFAIINKYKLAKKKEKDIGKI